MLRPLQAFGAHHFAFLRATFQGLDARSAWRRYLGFADDLPEAPLLERLRGAMLDELLQRAEARGSATMAHRGARRRLYFLPNE